MSKKKTNFIIPILIITGILIILLGVGQGARVFGLFGQQVWIPQYLSADCDRRAEDMTHKDLGEISDDGKFWECTSTGTGTYVPIVSGIQCIYYLDMPDFSTLDKRICDIDADNKDDSSCFEPEGFKFGTRDQFFVNAGKKIWLNPNTLAGKAKLSVEYPAWGLNVETADGRDLFQTTSCELSSLSRDYHTVGAGEAKVVVPGAPFNAVTGLQLAISTQAVTLEDVKGGEAVYITRPNYYYLIETADDGFLYVDTSLGERYDADIECIPRTTGCSDEAKIVELLDQSCDKYGGAITDYSPIAGDASKLCKYSCKDGKLSLTNDCVEVKADCPADKPLWDAKTGDCVATIPQEPLKGETDWLLWGLIGGGILLIIIAILTKVILDRRKKGK